MPGPVGGLRHRVHGTLAGQPMPAFAVVLIGPMMWTRFESPEGTVNLVSHATGLARDDVVIVTDEAVVAALAEGSLTAREARAHGLVKAYSSKPHYSPYAGRHHPTRPLFGDTHLHTDFSMNAGAFGARLTKRDAQRFAHGEEPTSNAGQPVKLSRPLDLLLVADHSDGMGFFPQPGASA